ncbi:MAG: hypothetical protein ACKOA8_10960 [Deltaproteobacteria bacterium]
MKRRNSKSKVSKNSLGNVKPKVKLWKPAKRLSDLVSVYEDLEKTLKRLKTSSLMYSSNSLMQINIQKLMAQLSKSKRRIERKISATLVSERNHLKHRLEGWSPKLRNKSSKWSKSKSDPISLN